MFDWFLNFMNADTDEEDDYDDHLNDLHDEFAMAALTGYLSAPGPVGDKARSDPETVAKWAYRVADECMKQRVNESKDGPAFNVENYP